MPALQGPASLVPTQQGEAVVLVGAGQVVCPPACRFPQGSGHVPAPPSSLVPLCMGARSLCVRLRGQPPHPVFVHIHVLTCSWLATRLAALHLCACWSAPGWAAAAGG